jgi:hypothetical protein
MVLLVRQKKKEKEDKMKKTAAIAALVVVVGGIFSASTIIQSAEAFIDPTTGSRTEPKAPMAASQDGNNVYVV